MSCTVWKYDLSVTDEQLVIMPRGAKLLHVGSQYGFAEVLQLWARVDPAEPQVNRRIGIHGTGHRVDEAIYVGTAIVADGHLVWHVFDGGESAMEAS